MRQPVYVLIIDDYYVRLGSEPLVSVHRNLQEAEEMLRAYTAELLPGWRMIDSEIGKQLAEYNERARLFACTTEDSTELVPFTEGATKARPDRFPQLRSKPMVIPLPGFRGVSDKP